MARISFAAMAVWLLASTANAQVIDPEYKIVDQSIRRDIAKDCGSLNPIRRDRCSREIRARYEHDGLVRGTSSYVRKMYSDLTVAELDNEIRRRNALFNQVRVVFTDRLPGELTHSGMEIEVSELRALINEKGGLPGQRRR